MKKLGNLFIIIVLILLAWIFIDSYNKGKGARERERESFRKNYKHQTTETLSSIEYARMQEARIKNIELVAQNRFKNYENEKLTKLGISSEIQHCVRGWSQNTGIEEALIYAIIEYESAYNSNLIVNGDYGLMQVNQINIDYYTDFYNGHINPLDINDNIYMGCQILKNNYRANNLHYTLMCYNMGKRKTDELNKRGIYKSEYSKKILDKKKSYERVLGYENESE